MLAILVECLFAYTATNGWKEIDWELYIFDSRGDALQDSWYYDESDGHWYYLNSDCKMVRGAKDKPLWLWIDGDFYAFDEGGRMYCDCVTADGYKVNARGAWVS